MTPRGCLASRRRGSPPPVEGSHRARARRRASLGPRVRVVRLRAVRRGECHAVVATWRPCLTAAQRASLHDEILRASPPAIAARVLVPALAPSRNPSGRRLDHVGQLAVAAEAARALARALDRGLAADIVASAATSVSADDSTIGADDARDALRALLSAADRCELRRARTRTRAKTPPARRARDVAEQILRAGAAAARGCRTIDDDAVAAPSAPPPSRKTPQPPPPRTSPRSMPSASRVAAATPTPSPTRLISPPSRRPVDEGNGPRPVCKRFGGVSSAPGPGDLRRPLPPRTPRLPTASSEYPLGLVVARVPDAHAVERLCGAVVRASSPSGLTWRAAERAFARRFAKVLGVSDDETRALRRTVTRAPRRAVNLPAIVRVAIVAPPKPPHSAEASAAPHLDQTSGARDVDFGRRRRRRSRRRWTQARIPPVDSRGERRASRTRRERGGGGVGGDGTERVGRGGGEGGRARALWRAGAARAHARRERARTRRTRADATPRTEGGHRARAAVDPSRPLTFRDDEDFGAGDAADDDDVSENAREREKDEHAERTEFECAVDADANDADATDARRERRRGREADANDADEFVASRAARFGGDDEGTKRRDGRAPDGTGTGRRRESASARRADPPADAGGLGLGRSRRFGSRGRERARACASHRLDAVLRRRFAFRAPFGRVDPRASSSDAMSRHERRGFGPTMYDLVFAQPPRRIASRAPTARIEGDARRLAALPERRRAAPRAGRREIGSARAKSSSVDRAAPPRAPCTPPRLRIRAVARRSDDRRGVRARARSGARARRLICRARRALETSRATDADGA